MRTIVDIPDEQLKRLSAFCRREHLSRAEAVRRAVQMLLEVEKTTSDGFKNAFGIWKHKKLDGRKMVEIFRQEWE